jgi:hypothetical protein
VSNFRVIFRRLKNYEVFALTMVALVGALRTWGDYEYSTRPHGDIYYRPSGRTLEIAVDLPVVAATNVLTPWYPDWQQVTLRTSEMLGLTVEMLATWLFWLALGRKLSHMRRSEARPSRIIFWASSMIAALLLAGGAYSIGAFVEWLVNVLRSDTSAPPGITIHAMKILILNGNGWAPLVFGGWLIATDALCGWVALRHRKWQRTSLPA